MKLTTNQIFLVVLGIVIVIYSSFVKGKKIESFTDSGLNHYLKQTTGIVCDEPLDSTSHNDTSCDRLAKKEDVRKTWHYFYDKPHNLSSISGIWKRNYKHGSAEGLGLYSNTDFPGNDIAYYRVSTDECKRIAENTPGAAGCTTGNTNSACWIKSKMVNKRRNRYVSSWVKGNGHQFTISFWFKINKENNGWRQILRIGSDSQYSRCPGIWVYPKGTAIHTRVSTVKNWNDGLDTRHGDISLHRWTHYTSTLKGRQLKIYINGNLLNETTLSGEPAMPPNMTIFGGNSSNKLNKWKYNNSDIELAEVKIYKFCLSDHVIKDSLAINPPQEYSFRIAGDGSEGRLEYKFNGKWGSVCDDLFDKNNKAATVACISMGYTSGEFLGNTGKFKKYRDPRAGSDQRGSRNTIHLDNVICSGSELNLADCDSLRGPTRHNCNHYEDVVLKCYPNKPSKSNGGNDPKSCALKYCNHYPDLRNAFCNGTTCSTEAQAVACRRHWDQYGKREKRDKSPEACAESAKNTQVFATNSGSPDSSVTEEECKNLNGYTWGGSLSLKGEIKGCYLIPSTGRVYYNTNKGSVAQCNLAQRKCIKR